jgi:hypothetical protein
MFRGSPQFREAFPLRLKLIPVNAYVEGGILGFSRSMDIVTDCEQPKMFRILRKRILCSFEAILLLT